jgi:hypothetical protein
MMKWNPRVLSFASFLFIVPFTAFAQRPELTLTLNEQFMDAAIDAVLQKGDPPAVDLRSEESDPVCRESLRLRRESNGVKTAVRFRDGKIIAPIAFEGSYRMPVIGCIDAAGSADAVVDLEFDQAGQRVVARAKITGVTLNGTGGVGKNLLGRLVQSSVDERINPIELVKLERLSFVFPIQNSGSLKLTAVGFRYTIQNGVISLHIAYDFIRN